MTPNVDSFTRSNLEEGAKLYRATFNAPPWNDEWTIAAAQTRLSEIVESPGYRGYRASLNSELVGLVMGNLERWYSGVHFSLKEMCVRPSHQNRGFGTALLEYLTNELRSEAVEVIYLYTMKDSPAYEFYESIGFLPNEQVGMQILQIDR